ncbi:MAG: phosphoribosylformylglycinamidine cyclo-ligase [Candidatus Portnoybacteria bacterium]|nr:phosphoribosylformylglycinamidine cyclo-ligase [Candidatus Portnoybacteria bacterium]
MTKEALTYKNVGVDYDLMDPFKRMCQLEAVKTAKNLGRFGLREVAFSRGESAYLIEFPDHYLAHVEEGLGTKNLVADEMRKLKLVVKEVYKLTGKTYYDRISQCAVAMIVNDMITLGALPVFLAMHLAVADGDWFVDKQRCCDLVVGWKEACDLAGASWGGGETATLKGIIVPGASGISGSAVGIIQPKDQLIDPTFIRSDDRIVLLESSGVHANGLTLAREIAERHPMGYGAQLSDGSLYGEALLAPTIIYVKAIEALQYYGIPIHYAVNITGHGWRKLMRASEPFVYIVEKVPDLQPVFVFMQERGYLSDREVYGNLNMGAGFALYLSEEDVESAVGIIQNECGIRAWNAGRIEKRGQQKKVVIEPKNLVFPGKSLKVR